MKKDRKLFPIKNGKVTLYGQMNNNGTQFNFRGFTVKDDGNLYMPGVSEFNRIDLGGRPCVDIKDHLFGIYKALANAQLKEYLDQHICDGLSPSDFKLFWHSAGRQLDINDCKEIRLGRVSEGVVGIEINRIVCNYNFVTHKPVGYHEYNCAHKELITTPLQVLYGNRLIPTLALEQYRRGLAPPIYTELARLNAFLEGRKSVKLVMKGGAMHEYKHHSGYEIYLSMLFNYAPDNAMPFELDDCYDLKPQFGRNRPLAALDYLQYGKHRFVIDLEALGQFERKEAGTA